MSSIGILALDTARATGWAVLRADGSLASGTKILGRKDMRVGPLLANYSDWLSRQVDEYAPEFIYYEQPWVGPKTSQGAALILMSLAGVTHMVGYRNRVMVRAVLNPQVVKHWTGDGGGKRVVRKARVFAEAQARNLAPETEDEADALAILSYAAHCLGIKTDIPAGPLFAPSQQGEAA